MVTAPLRLPKLVYILHSGLLQVVSTFVLLEQHALSRSQQQTKASDPIYPFCIALHSNVQNNTFLSEKKIIQACFMIKSFIERKIHYKATNRVSRSFPHIWKEIHQRKICPLIFSLFVYIGHLYFIALFT